MERRSSGVKFFKKKYKNLIIRIRFTAIKMHYIYELKY